MPADRRVALLALLGSVALHAALMVFLPQRSQPAEGAKPAPPIMARLVEPAPSVATPQQPAIPAATPAPASSKIETRRAVARAKPVKKLASPRPSRHVEPAAAAPMPQLPQAPAAPSPPAPPEQVASAAPSAPVVSADELKAREEGLIASYRAQLLAAARQFKRYPRLAMDNNWEGEVRIRVAVTPENGSGGLDVAESSGHAVLDRQALEMFRHARRVVPIPAPLEGKPFTLELRAVYRLNVPDSG